MTVVEPGAIMSCMTKLSPEAEQALDVAAARYALQQAEGSDLLDKVRAIELAVKRRRAPLSALLGLLMFGCAQVDAPSGPLTLSPDANVAAAVADAVAAWSTAAGVEIVIAPGGVPVRSVDGLEDCGSTYTARKDHSGKLVRIEAIEIRTDPTDGCMPWPATLRHELGHALQQWASPDARPDTDGHTPSGLMAAKASGIEVVDEPAIEKVCAVASCSTFEPEHD